MEKKRKKFYRFILIGIFFVFAYWAFEKLPALKFDWFESLELVTLNFRMKIRNINGPMKHTDKVIIAGIDDRSMLDIRYKNQDTWPWKRSVFADLINKLGAAGAKSIVIDVTFEDPNPDDLEGDRLFAESMFMNPIVTFGTTLITNKKEFSRLPEVYRKELAQNLDYIRFRYRLANPEQNYIPSFFAPYKLITPYSLFMNSAWAYGSLEIGLPEEDGRYHTVTLVTNETFLNEQGKGSLILLPNQDILGLCSYFQITPDECVLDLKSHRILLSNYRSIPVDSNGCFTINYYGSKSFQEVSVIDILERDPAKLEKLFKDKIVLVGYTANSKGLFDLRPTPFNKNEAGIQIHATLISNILEQNYLQRMPFLYRMLIMIILFSVFSYILLMPNLRSSIVWALFFIVGFTIANFILFTRNIWIDLFYPDLAMFILFVYNTITRVYQENREKLQIKDFFTKYVPAPVVEQILKNPSRINLGGEKMNITVLFSDIVGFTSISEQMEPVELVRLLNEYLTEMTAIIKDEYGGTLDKFIGDAIVAIFGAPFPREDDAARAVNAALAMQNKVIELQQRWKERGEEHIFGIGVGINTGSAVVGNIGSPDRLNYTCIGDTVNTAARLEAATRTTGANILISDSTYQQVKDYFNCESLPPLFVKGKRWALTVFSVISKIEK